MQALKRLIVALAFGFFPSKARAGGGGNLSALAGDLSRAAVKFAKKRLAIATFQGARGGETYSGSVVSERLIAQLLAQGGIDVVERKLLSSVMREQRLERFGVVDPRTVKTLGKVLGVEAIVTGTVVELRDGRVEINARLVDAESAKVLAAAIATVEKEWSDFAPEEVMNVPVPELPDFELDRAPTFAMRDSVSDTVMPGSSKCGAVQSEVDELERATVDLKARYWAARLKDPSFSRRALKQNPGTEIDNAELKGRFYSQLRLWYDKDGAPALSDEEISVLNQQEKRIKDLSDSCRQEVLQ